MKKFSFISGTLGRVGSAGGGEKHWKRWRHFLHIRLDLTKVKIIQKILLDGLFRTLHDFKNSPAHTRRRTSTLPLIKEVKGTFRNQDTLVMRLFLGVGVGTL